MMLHFFSGHRKFPENVPLYEVLNTQADHYIHMYVCMLHTYIHVYK
jgi:hypothetical protein